MNFLNNINFFGGLSSAIQAVILLIIAFIVASIARNVVRKLLSKYLVSRKSSGSEEADAESVRTRASLVNIIANLAYAIVFMLFLPGALQKLGVDSVANPLSGMASKFINFLPNIIAAILIMVFGIFLARLVEQLLEMGLRKTKIDDLQTKYVTKSAGGNSFSKIIAKIAYVLIMIVFVVAALQVLNLQAVSEPATQMLATIVNFIPRLFAAIVVVLVGLFLAKIVSGLLDGVLEGAGIDDKTAAFLPKKEDGAPMFEISNIVSVIVKILIAIFFVVAGLNILGVETLTRIGSTIIAYLPNILAAVIILVIAWILAAKASEAILKASPDSKGLALAAKSGIFVLAAFMALTQLGIASKILTLLFAAIVIAVAVAFAIAFGVGGRSWAGKKLEEIDEKFKKEVDKIKKD